MTINASQEFESILNIAQVYVTSLNYEPCYVMVRLAYIFHAVQWSLNSFKSNVSFKGLP